MPALAAEEAAAAEEEAPEAKELAADEAAVGVALADPEVEAPPLLVGFAPDDSDSVETPPLPGATVMPDLQTPYLRPGQHTSSMILQLLGQSEGHVGVAFASELCQPEGQTALPQTMLLTDAMASALRTKTIIAREQINKAFFCIM